MRRVSASIMILAILVMSVSTFGGLVNRYSFTVDPNDSVGTSNGVLTNGATIYEGQVVLNGGTSWSAPCVTLPPDVLKDYTSVTIEVWYSLDGTSDWQRLFDFGDSAGGEAGAGGNYIFYTPTSGGADSRFVISTGGIPGYNYNENLAVGPDLVTGATYHVACVYDAATSEIRLYQDGKFVNSSATSHLLSNVGRSFAYIGSSTYRGDAAFAGKVNEFRIYNRVLNGSELALTYFKGPDTVNPLFIAGTDPADGQTNVPVNPTLSWVIDPAYAPTAYDLYVGTDPNIIDPNVPNVAAISIIKQLGLTTNSYAIPTAQTLTKDKMYYWRVDAVIDGVTYQGAGQSFKTIPNAPVFTTNPSYFGFFPGETVSMTAVAEDTGGGALTLKWYKAGTPAQEVIADGTHIMIDTVSDGKIYTSTLMINAIAKAEAGAYYVTATNTGGTATSTSGYFICKQLLAYYPFEGNADDASANGMNGTLATLGTAPNNILPTYAAGKVGQAISLSNTYSNYVDLPDGFDDFRTGITINLWAYPTVAGNWANFIQFSNGAPNNNIFFCRNGTSTNLQFRTANGTTQLAAVVGNGAIALNQWQMFTVTMDQSGVIKLFKNGVLYFYYNVDGSTTTPTATIALPIFVTRVNNYIGKSAWGDNYFTGQMDEVRVYNYALTPEEIAARYIADADLASMCLSKPAYDYTNDCKVTLDDFALFAGQWLDCGLYPASVCD
ncbi:MAG: LamG-like jellyroll fold domain-containing protein [Anaerohalosphaeraceae bacterium]